MKALMGHEYVGIVEETGDDVTTIKSGQFVIGSFFASGNTCPLCQAGYQSRGVHSEYVGAGGVQAELLRVPLADGTLVAQDVRGVVHPEARSEIGARTGQSSIAQVAGLNRGHSKTPTIRSEAERRASARHCCTPACTAQAPQERRTETSTA
ncbi:alcohol dehydrogenase catalytic domain-containing protein [Pseudonocardia ammonioxydans]|uniref:alcohol dehydrogenase catalytic domain-containing protein n=1 Tax=Pseudonocardia ammonioxydans TaxID=260086 RepID=UPI000B2F8172|nr:alcohol dehydrogenase catalytic domain-containing protein [Pseudonocardia ammonioxydans]